MSDEGQDVELRVLVAQTLENNGVLSKIRAELRASVFLALEDQDGATKTQILNKPLKEFVSSVEGSLILSLVRELLEFFELKYTLSVFDPETRCGKDYSYDGRNQLLKELKIRDLNGRKEPLLVQILKLAQGLTPDNDNTLAKTNENNAEPKQSLHISSFQNVNEEMSPIHSTSNHLTSVHSSDESNHMDSIHTSNMTNPSLHRTENNTVSSHSTKSENILSNQPNETSHLNSKAQEPLKQATSLLYSRASEDVATKQDVVKPQSTFSLLGNLPPLLNLPKASNAEQNQGKDLNQLNKALLDLGLDSPDNYDEDFNSSISGSAREDPTKGSDSEIEEDILSNPSAVEDAVADVTLSHSSGVADYMEEVFNVDSSNSKANLNHNK